MRSGQCVKVDNGIFQSGGSVYCLDLNVELNPCVRHVFEPAKDADAQLSTPSIDRSAPLGVRGGPKAQDCKVSVETVNSVQADYKCVLVSGWFSQGALVPFIQGK